MQKNKIVSTTRGSIAVAFAAMCAAMLPGCASVSLTEVNQPEQRAACLSCVQPAPIPPAIVVTRPSACNDYPVAYRIHTADNEPRVKYVDSVRLQSGGPVALAPGRCFNH